MSTSKVVAGIAILRIGGAPADMGSRIDDQGMAFADDVVGRPRGQVGDVAVIPIGRPAPEDVAKPQSGCECGNQCNRGQPTRKLNGPFTPLMRDASTAQQLHYRVPA